MSSRVYRDIIIDEGCLHDELAAATRESHIAVVPKAPMKPPPPKAAMNNRRRHDERVEMMAFAAASKAHERRLRGNFATGSFYREGQRYTYSLILAGFPSHHLPATLTAFNFYQIS